MALLLILKYNLANIIVRWRSTLATIFGVGLVVAVFVLVQALAAGLEKSSRSTGDERNLLIVRKGSTAESNSQVSRDQVMVMQYLPGVARDPSGKPLVSADVLVLINLPRKSVPGEANVLVRGISPQGLALRPQVSITEGRMFTPGKREIIVSHRLAARFANFDIGSRVKSAGQMLTVVGHFDGQKTAFDSEVWMDADESRSIYDRDFYSSVLLRMDDSSAAKALRDRIESDKRLPLLVLGEPEYYASQTRTATPIKFLGYFLAVTMSIGAIFAAMNTMYASVGARTREVGTLRVLGFRRRVILLSFMIEGIMLATLGGVLGDLLALPMNGYATGTLSFESFSEVVFEFRITPLVATQGIVFAMIVGAVGSLLPAIRASRLPVIAALKSL